MAARILGPQGRGELAAIQTVPVLLGMLALAGMPGALAFFCAREQAKARTYYAGAITVGVVLAIGFSLAGYLLLPRLLHRQTPEVVEAARMYLLFIPAQVLQALPHNVLLGVGAFRSWNLLRLTPSLAWLVVLLTGGLLRFESAARFSAWYLAAYALTIPATTWAMARNTKGSPIRPSATTISALLRFGAPGALASMPLLLNLRLDQVVMSAVVPARELGLYAVAVAWSGALTPILGATAPLILPLLARPGLSGNERWAAAARAARLSVFAATVGSLIVCLATPVATRLLFGKDFDDAMPAAVILAVAGGFAGFNGLAGEVLKGLGAPRWSLIGELVSLPLTVGLLFALLPRIGILGAAIASLLAYSATSLVMFRGLRRITGVPGRHLCVPRIADVAGLWASLRHLSHRS